MIVFNPSLPPDNCTITSFFPLAEIKEPVALKKLGTIMAVVARVESCIKFLLFIFIYFIIQLHKNPPQRHKGSKNPLPRRVSLSVSSRLTRGGSAEWGLCAYVGSPNET
jgi:hypothetical protein